MSYRVHLAAAATLLASLVAFAATGAHSVGAQVAPATFGGRSVAFTSDGLANVVFAGGSVDDLDAAAAGASASGVWAQDGSGAFSLLVVGGPSFLKDGFRAKFPAGFKTAAAVTLTRAARPPAAPASAGSASPAPAAPSAATSVGYPRPLLFRSAFEALGVRGGSVDQAVALAASYDLVIVKALDEELLDRLKVAPYLRALKQRSPQKIVLDHYDFQSHHPQGTSPTIFPGHWLMLAGTTLTSSVSDAASDTTFSVANAAAVRVDDDLQVVALDASGIPDYTRTEQMRVTAVTGNRVTVERGAYGSARLSFDTNRARAAAHARVTWDGTNRNWHLNYCLDAPRDPQGRRLIEAEAQALAGYLQPGGILDGLDGYQFDVERFEPPGSENAGPRRIDCDADGQPDSGFVRGVNSYGLGVVAFQQTLRRLAGDRAVLISEATGAPSSRDTAYANGIENESFPDFHHWELFSSAYQRYQYWTQQARAPQISYLQLKETTEAFTRCPADDAGTNWKYRLTLGAALLGHGYFGYLSTNEAGSPQCNYLDPTTRLPLAEPEELLGTRDLRTHYLGAPRGDAQRVDRLAGAPNLLANGGFEQDTSGATLVLARGAVATMTRDTANAGEGSASLRMDLQQLLPDPDDTHVQVRLGAFRVAAGREYTLTFRVRANPGYAAIDPAYADIATRVAVNLTAGGLAPAQQDVMADGRWRTYSLSFVAAADDAQASLAVLLGKQAGSVWLDSLRLQQGPGDVFARAFDRGVVLVNGSTEAVPFDLGALFPGMTLRRIKGTQDPAVNTGEAVQGTVTVPARDALILVGP